MFYLNYFLMLKWICIVLGLFLVFVAVSYNKSYNDTLGEYEAYDFSEFSSTTQIYTSTSLARKCNTVHNQWYILRHCK